MALTKVTYSMIEGASVNVLDYGAKGDGLTDDTAAFTAALANGKVVFVPASSSPYIVDGVVMSANSKLYSFGNAILKRKNNATQSSMIKCDSINNFIISGVKLDGNKANQTVIGHGIYVVDTTDSANFTFSFIENNNLIDHNGHGILIERSSSIRIIGNTAANNTYNGITVQDPQQPVPSSATSKHIIVSENETSNCAVGIQILGTTAGSTALGEILSQSNYVNGFFVVNNNSCHDNALIGLCCQGTGFSVTGNVLERNGNGTSYGGALFNCGYSSFTGNTVVNNYYYGVDAGFACFSEISGNVIYSNGKVIGQAIGLNLGATNCVAVIGNKIGDNGGTSGGSYQILASGIDGSLAAWAPFTGFDLNIRANDIEINGANPYYVGIQVTNGFSGVNITENTFYNRTNGTVMRVLLPGDSTCVERNKVLDSASSWQCSAASAGFTVIPDYGEVIEITGTDTINSLFTTTQLYGRDKVCTVVMTNNGSGYTSAPTVSLVGGGGTNATGTPALAANGRIYGVYITDYGSGYTPGATFSVGFSGGGGAGAAATAYVGCDNAVDRVVVLKFTGAAVVKHNVGNIYLNGTDFTGSSTASLTLRSDNGNWYEVSRSA